MNDTQNKPPLAQMQENAAEAEQLLKQLANKHRLMILCQLVQGEMSVSDIQKNAELSQSSLSQHLAKLREQAIVATRKEGQQVFYRLASMQVNALLSTLYLIYCK